MSIHPQPLAPIPKETALVAHVALSHGNTYVIMRDQLGTFYDDHIFADLFSKRGCPAEASWQVALVCIFQFLEGLSAVQLLRQSWVFQYYADDGRLRWRKAEGLPPIGKRYASPMIQKPTMAINAPLSGRATKFMSQKRVMTTNFM